MPQIFPISPQKPKNTGRSHFPTVDSHKTVLPSMARVQTGRISPSQIPKECCSHIQKAPTINTRSQNQFRFRRKGRKNP